MTTLRAISQSPDVRRLMEGAVRDGSVLGHGYVDVGGYVVGLTSPGAPRMPNGVEVDWELRSGTPVRVGEGALRIGPATILPGRDRTARARPHVLLHAIPSSLPDPALLAGLGQGLTPAGDDLLIGFVASLALYHRAGDLARRVAAFAGPRTTALSRTLLHHAARGELPEVAHRFLASGDAEGLLRFGHSSGRFLLAGLALGCFPEPDPTWTGSIVTLHIALDGLPVAALGSSSAIEVRVSIPPPGIVGSTCSSLGPHDLVGEIDRLGFGDRDHPGGGVGGAFDVDLRQPT